MIRAHAVISGRVQGVDFRYSTVREARRLDLQGWVRNTDDGNVELLAEGTAEQVHQLIAWCHDGPPGARVTDVRYEEVPIDSSLREFGVRY